MKIYENDPQCAWVGYYTLLNSTPSFRQTTDRQTDSVPQLCPAAASPTVDRHLLDADIPAHLTSS